MIDKSPVTVHVKDVAVFVEVVEYTAVSPTQNSICGVTNDATGVKSVHEIVT